MKDVEAKQGIFVGLNVTFAERERDKGREE